MLGINFFQKYNISLICLKCVVFLIIASYLIVFHLTFFSVLASWRVITSGESVMIIDPSLRKWAVLMIGTVGIVYQAFIFLIMDAVYEDRLVVQELAKGVTMSDVTMFPVFIPSDLIFQLLPFSSFDKAVCCGISCSRIKVVEP